MTFTNLIIFCIIYYAIISVVGVYLTISDKHRAIKGVWRISENTLMLCGFLGAALPMYITMKKVCHKTKHAKFMIGLPAEIILHIILMATIIYSLSI